MHRVTLLVMCFATGLVSAAQWHATAPDSQLTFTALQSGAGIEGRLPQFTAQVAFDATHLDECQFDVAMDMASVDTGDAERDEVLKSDEMLDVERFPQARYVSKGCHANGQQFVSTGKLTLRDVTREVPITFTVADGMVNGSARIKRLDFEIGAGEWGGYQVRRQRRDRAVCIADEVSRKQRVSPE